MLLQGKIIRPPPEIRAVADKTASFVAKNGRAFETRILNSVKGKTPKFSFLHDGSPFRAYYEGRIAFFENYDEDGKDEKKEKNDDTSVSKDMKIENYHSGHNKVGEPSKGGDKTFSGDGKTQQQQLKSSRKMKSVVDPVARALLTQRSKLEGNDMDMENNNDEDRRDELGQQSQIEYTTPIFGSMYTATRAPSFLTPAKVELIRLTAQFSAINGKGGTFLRDLTMREWNDPTDTFGFVQPRHVYFAYFSHLVDLYKKILAGAILLEKQPPKQGGGNGEVEQKQEQENLSANNDLVKTTFHTMVSIPICTSSLSITGGSNSSNESVAAKKLAKDVNAELHLLTSTAGKASKCLEIVAYNAEYHKLEQKRKQRGRKQGDKSNVIMSAFVDWHDFVVVETIDFDKDEVVEVMPPRPLPQPPSPSLASVITTMANDDGRGIDESSSSSSDDDDVEKYNEDEKIHVVTTYEPRVVSSKSQLTDSARTHIVDPITGRSIPISEMTEHMRIHLLDPKWATEKKRFVEKQRDSNFVQGDDIAKNVDAFARARGDIFGSPEKDLHSWEDMSQPCSTSRSTTLSTTPVQEKSSQASDNMVPPKLSPIASGVLPPSPLLHNKMQGLCTPVLSSYHPKPDLTAPDAKKLRVENMLAVTLTEGTGSVGVTKEPTPPIPPVATGVTFTTTGTPVLPTVPSAVSMILPPGVPVIIPPPSIQGYESTKGAVVDNIVPNVGDETATETMTLLSEADFLESLTDPDVALSICVPNDPSNTTWDFHGQTIAVTVHAMTKIRDVKQELKAHLGDMPVNKMQLRSRTMGFLKDLSTLAFLNIGGQNCGVTACLELVPKVRGGRK